MKKKLKKKEKLLERKKTQLQKKKQFLTSSRCCYLAFDKQTYPRVAVSFNWYHREINHNERVPKET